MAHLDIGRRAALAAMGLLSAGALAGARVPPEGSDAPRDDSAAPHPLTPGELGWSDAGNEYILPQLPYSYNALEPHIDEFTMRLHHEQHHRAHVGQLNRALRKLWEIREGRGDESLTGHWLRQVSFNGSGHFNHALFWRIMAPPSRGGGGQPQGPLGRAIAHDFDSFQKFSQQFQQAARSVEGCGWAWLVVDRISSRLAIIQMESQQNSTMNGMIPLMGIDIWEHAYYLRYQNRRTEYVAAFMNVINWPLVNDLFVHAGRRDLRPSAAGPVP